jgi:hypothetical protein
VADGFRRSLKEILRVLRAQFLLIRGRDGEQRVITSKSGALQKQKAARLLGVTAFLGLRLFT